MEDELMKKYKKRMIQNCIIMIMISDVGLIFGFIFLLASIFSDIEYDFSTGIFIIITFTGILIRKINDLKKYQEEDLDLYEIFK